MTAEAAAHDALVEALLVCFLLHRDEAPHRRPPGSAAKPTVPCQTDTVPSRERLKGTQT